MLFDRFRGIIKKNNNKRRYPKGKLERKVVTMPLTGLEDVPLIEMSIENGNIVILSIATIRLTKLVVVKRVVQNVNAFIRKHGGDIAQLGRNFIIIVPQGIDLAFPANTQEKIPNKDTIDLGYEQRVSGEAPRGMPRSDVDPLVTDPIFGY